MNIDDALESKKLQEIQKINGVSVGFDEESGYLDFNLTDDTVVLKDVIDLVTYALSPNGKYFERYGTQAKDIIDHKALPPVIDCERHFVEVIELIAESMKNIKEDVKKVEL